jgi:nucleotide-binding universal stress UspA family protein
MTEQRTGQRTGQPRVVVGVDGSDNSARALRWGVLLAERFGAQLDVVTAWEYPNAYGWGGAAIGWEPRETMEREQKTVLEAVFGTAPPANLRVRIMEGSPGTALLEAARDATMLVVGSRGHGGFVGLLLGSVSARVAEHCSCPVLIVHGADEAPPTAASASATTAVRA